MSIAESVPHGSPQFLEHAWDVVSRRGCTVRMVALLHREAVAEMRAKGVLDVFQWLPIRDRAVGLNNRLELSLKSLSDEEVLSIFALVVGGAGLELNKAAWIALGAAFAVHALKAEMSVKVAITKLEAKGGKDVAPRDPITPTIDRLLQAIALAETEAKDRKELLTRLRDARPKPNVSDPANINKRRRANKNGSFRL